MIPRPMWFQAGDTITVKGPYVPITVSDSHGHLWHNNPDGSWTTTITWSIYENEIFITYEDDECEIPL